MKTKLLFILLLSSVLSFGQSVGDIVITELMPDPSGTEANTEWFEIHNTTGASIDINGWSIKDTSSGDRWHLIDNNGGTNTGQSLVIPAGGYAILAPQFTADGGPDLGGVSILYAYGYPNQSPATSTTVGSSNFPRFNNTNSFDDGVSSNVTDGSGCNSNVDGDGMTDDETDGVGMVIGTVAGGDVTIIDEAIYDYGYNNAALMSGATNPTGGTPDLTTLPGWDSGSVGLSGSSCFNGNASLDDNVTFQLIASSWIFSNPSGAQVGVFYGTPGAANGNTLSTEELTASDFKVFPNPATNLVTIQSGDDIGISSVALYNVLGKEVLSINKSVETIDVSNLSKGIYLLKIQAKEGIATKKLILE